MEFQSRRFNQLSMNQRINYMYTGGIDRLLVLEGLTKERSQGRVNYFELSSNSLFITTPVQLIKNELDVTLGNNVMIKKLVKEK